MRIIDYSISFDNLFNSDPFMSDRGYKIVREERLLPTGSRGENEPYPAYKIVKGSLADAGSFVVGLWAVNSYFVERADASLMMRLQKDKVDNTFINEVSAMIQAYEAMSGRSVIIEMR